MAAPTSISVEVDASEYSRYESARSTVTATVTVSGGAPYSADEVLVRLVKDRGARDASIEEQTVSFSGTTDTQQAVVEFDLSGIEDSDGINLARAGDYFVRALDAATETVTGESDSFVLRIVSVERFKRDYLFGIPLTGTRVKMPKTPLSSITGVTITEVAPGTRDGVGSLSYIYVEDITSDPTASIGAGANGTVNITADDVGVDGNLYSVVVELPAGTSPLSASFASNVLTVSLAATSGAPTAGANTATLIAAAIDALSGFTATASGTGADEITAAETALFSGGATDVVRQLSWRGGPVVTVSSPGTYILRAGSEQGCASSSTNYIVVRVRSTALLPSSSVAEDVLIGEQTLDDETIAQYLDQAQSWIEEVFLPGVFLEPTNIVTDPDPTVIQFSSGVGAPVPIFTDTDYDKVVSPLTYFKHSGQEWLNIWTPYKRILRVDALYGAVANVRVIDINLSWIEHAKGSYMQVVPFHQETAFDFIGLIWVNSLHGTRDIPNFWRFNMWVGEPKAPPVLVDLLGRRAAIDIATMLAAAFRPGLTSLSLSRDGVSESSSYANTLTYGIYTGLIQAHKDWLEENKHQIKARFKGLDWRVL